MKLDSKDDAYRNIWERKASDLLNEAFELPM